MNAADLVDRLAERTGMPRRVARLVLKATLGEIVAELAASQRVTLSGFGTFDVRDRPARARRHPATGQVVTSPGQRAVVFRAGRELKSALSGADPSLALPFHKERED